MGQPHADPARGGRRSLLRVVTLRCPEEKKPGYAARPMLAIDRASHQTESA